MLAKTPTRRQRVLNSLPLLAILLLAALLRCYRLDAQSLWNDEGTSVQLALRSLPAIARDAAADIHPPLYYYLLHSWIGLAGTSEWAVRSLSALLGVLTVGLIYGLCRPLGKKTALLAALLTAISPLCVYYGQETRMYMLLACLAAASTWALTPLEQDVQPRWHAHLLYGVLAAAGIYTHYMGFAVLLAHNLAWLVNWITQRGQTRRERWPALLRWALLQGAILLTYLPWLLTSWASLSGWPAVREPLRLSELFSEALQVLPFGVTMPFSRTTLLVAAALAVLAVASLLPSRETDSDTDSARRSALWRLMLAVIVPIALIYLLSLSRPMYKKKFLIVCAPFYAALLAHGLVTLHTRFSARHKRRWLPNMVGVLLLLLPIGASAVSLDYLYHDPTYSRDDYRGIVAYIQATADPDDPILINAPSQVETVSYYHHGPQPLAPLPLQRPLDPDQTEAALEQLVAGSERIYAIYWATDESDPDGYIESWLAARCYKAMDSWFGNLRLVVYAVPAARGERDRIPLGVTFGEDIRLDGYTLLTPATDSGDILQLGLTWQALADIPTRFKVFVHLLDERGTIVSQRDSEPLGGQRPTTSWTVGEVVEDAYGLWVRPGTPPGEHTLSVGLYDAESGERLVVASSETVGISTGVDAIDLATVTITSPGTPPPIEALDMAQLDDIHWEGLTLLGHSLHKLGFAHTPETPLRPGDLIELILFWQRSEGAPPETYRLSLCQGRDEVWSQECTILGERYSPWGWAMGETIREVQTIGLPGDIPPGRYDLLIEPLSSGPSAERLQRLNLNP